MSNHVIIDSNITPTDVKIYVENGTPYLDYTGICYASNGDKIKVHFPKIDLTLTNITQEKEYEEWKYQWESEKYLQNLMFARQMTNGLHLNLLNEKCQRNSLKRSLVIS